MASARPSTGPLCQRAAASALRPGRSSMLCHDPTPANCLAALELVVAGAVAGGAGCVFRRRSRRAGTGRHRCLPGGRGDSGGAPCRGGRAQSGRALRHADAGGGGHGDRGGLDRRTDAGRRRHRFGAGPRHGVRRDHDRVQRRGRPVRAGGRPAPPRAGLSGRGHQPHAGGAGGAGHAHPGAANLHHQHRRAHVLKRATGFRRRGVVGAVRRVCLRADGAPPRLLSARDRRRRPGQPCRTAVHRGGLGQSGSADAVLGGGGGAGQNAGANDRRGGEARRRTGVGGGRGDRDAGAGARDAGGGARGVAQPAADQPEPGAGLGAWPASA